MYISRQLKEKNVAEYLLYMWQVEDLIRAHGADVRRLVDDYISRFELSDVQRGEMEEWYAGLIDMMREEGVMEKGHLQINKNIIILLTDLHLQLLQSPKYPFYHAVYYKALPHIVELRRKGLPQDEPELENCFEVLYGTLLLRLQGKAVGEATDRAVSDITKMLGMLSDYYRKDKEGALKFD
ncbi:MAG: DUF4924 family protein [Clostridium sp.]|nr:DUF4924 family protein [Clostridium sp.]